MIKVSPRTKKTSFTVELPDAQNVVLVGDFNEWNSNATPMKKSRKSGVWKADVQLTSGEYEFRYLVNESQWLNDEQAPTVQNTFGSENSVAKVELPKTTKKVSAKRTKKSANGKA